MAGNNQDAEMAPHVLRMAELINNENEFIDWEYWVGKMPILTAYQAVRLMAALDPNRHADLSFKRNETAGKAKEQAQSFETLAASHRMTDASPRDWLKWADDLGEPVHGGFRAAIDKLQIVRRAPEISKAPPQIEPLAGGRHSRELDYPKPKAESRVTGSGKPSQPHSLRKPRPEPRAPRWPKWRLMPEVKVWQAVALSLGIEPEQVRTESNAWMGAKYPFDEGDDFTDRLDVTIANMHDRARFPTPCTVNMGHAYLNGTHLAEFARFAVEVARWDVPDELHALVTHSSVVQASTDAPAPTTGNDVGLTRRERQIQAIEAVADRLKYARQQIPTGGKTKIRAICLKEHSTLFASKDQFDHAWKAASPERVAMANRAKFAGK